MVGNIGNYLFYINEIGNLYKIHGKALTGYLCIVFILMQLAPFYIRAKSMAILLYNICIYKLQFYKKVKLGIKR